MASYFDTDADDEVLSVDELELNNYKPSKKNIKLKSTIDLENSDDDDDEDMEQYGGAIDDDDEIDVDIDDDLDVKANTSKLQKPPISYDDDDEELDEEDDDDDDDDELFNEEDLNENPDEEKETKQQKKIKQLPQSILNTDNSDDEEEDDDDENYLKKFDKEINKNYMMNFHPECIRHNYDEIEALTKVVRDSNNIVIDSLHRTIPYITKYERTRILGQRAKQINAGATPFVKVPENVIDGYLVAELELLQKRIPFIIQRPLPNGGCEYWNVKDLENISF